MKTNVFTIMAVLAVSLAFSTNTEAAPVEWPVADGGNGHYYEVIQVDGGINWSDAKDAAEGKTYLGFSGHLVTLNSSAENDFVTSLMNGIIDAGWAGGYQPAGSPEPDGNWQWITGEQWVFSNWKGLEPNNNGDENVIQIMAADHPLGQSWQKAWNDLSIYNTQNGYIVEYAPEPPCSYQFVTKWGSNGSGDGQFNDASAIAIDSSGYIYVVDRYNHRVQKFDSNGTLIGWFGGDDAGGSGWHEPLSGRYGVTGSGDGQFNRPINIAIDSSDFIFIADENQNRIQKLTSDGTPVTKWTVSQFPYGVAVDSAGYVYVTSHHGHYVAKFEPNEGTYTEVTRWGTLGSSDEQLYYPIGIAVDASGYVYVVDHYNHRIQKFDSNGIHIGWFGGDDAGGSGWHEPNSGRQPQAGNGEGQFNYPHNIAFDSSGYAYVTDRLNYRVQKFDSNGTLIGWFGGDDTGGSGWHEPNSGRQPQAGSGEGQFDFITDVTADTFGNIYTTDKSIERVQKFAPICEPPCEDGGWIAFVSYQDGDAAIWAVRPDGTGLRQLTNRPGSEFTPQWSPDSTRIAYATGEVTVSSQLWIYDWFAETNTKVYDAHDYEGQDLGSYSVYMPAWSPDGTKILFREEASYNNPHITVINGDGTGRQIVPVQSGYVSNPSWSPSGTAFVYERRNGGTASNDLWIYDFTQTGDIMDGNNIRLTQGASSESTTKISPDWRPSGDIVFAWGHNLAVINPGESGNWGDPTNPDVTFLTNDASYPSLTYQDPSWSPDLSQIVYWYYHPGGGVDDLWIMDADGGNRNPLTSTPYREEHPVWGNPICNTDPIAICKDVNVPADSNCQGYVTPEDINDGSFDPDGDEITLSLDPAGPYPLGQTSVTLTISDGIASATCEATVTIIDGMPPEIVCPNDVILECPADTSVAANGSATGSDACGDVTITHSDSSVPGCGNTEVITRTWTATDECGNSSSCVQVITVQDTTPPDFTLSVTPDVLWPPNHKMVQITPGWTVSDNCDESVEVTLISITMNEGDETDTYDPSYDDTEGDGNTTDDIQVDSDGSIYLRAERNGKGDGRTYTITYQAADDCGNVTVRSAIVTVPHDQS